MRKAPQRKTIVVHQREGNKLSTLLSSTTQLTAHNDIRNLKIREQRLR